MLWVLVFLSGVYGGYFGAAQGVLLLGLMGVAFTDSMQRINAVKNVLAGLVNGIAAVVFMIATHIDWGAAGLIAAGAILGGQVGARIGRKLPPWGLRVLIICVGVAALVKLLASPSALVPAQLPGGSAWLALVVEAVVARVNGAEDAPADVEQLAGLGLGQRVEDKAPDGLDVAGGRGHHRGAAGVGEHGQGVAAVVRVWGAADQAPALQAGDDL